MSGDVPAVEAPVGLVAPVPRVALTPEEAAAALGLGRSAFYEHVLPRLRTVRAGRRVLVPVRELQRFVDAEAS